MTNMPVTASGDVDNAMKMLQNAAIRSMRDKVAETYRKDLVNIDPDYRNIYNEYRDGILLYNISNQEVWERAAKDTTGLEKYFAEHRADYTWKAPKFKGYVIFSTNDSVQTEVKAFTDSLDNAGSDFTREELVKMIDKRFGRDAKVERVLAAKGDNAITDYLAFDGPKPENQKMRWQSYYAYRGRVIDQPEDAFDVRGQVTTDYQAVLEKNGSRNYTSASRSKSTAKYSPKPSKSTAQDIDTDAASRPGKRHPRHLTTIKDDTR